MGMEPELTPSGQAPQVTAPATSGARPIPLARGDFTATAEPIGTESAPAGVIRTMAEAYEESALPCRRGVTLTEGEGAAPEPAEARPLPAALTAEPAATKGAAQWAYERVLLYLQNFERQLDGAQEVALGFAGSEAGVLRIEGVGFFDPDILTFYGRDEEGLRTQLIQHVSQLNLLLRAVPKLSPDDTPARRFGFELQGAAEKSPASEAKSRVEGAVTGQPE